MDHKEIKELISSYHDGELNEEQKKTVEEHLAQCPECRREFQEMGKLEEVMSQMELRKPPKEVWQLYWASVYNRLERRIGWILLSIGAMLLFFFVISGRSQGKEQGTFSIYFMEEKVGYEEYIWEGDERGYLLSVIGRMTKPTAIEIEKLSIRLDRNYIPHYFYFKGSVSGMDQEISSTITEGQVENKIQVAGQERMSTVKIERDAFLLPNPVFSPYMVLTKKFRCALEGKIELSAYIIPQLEVSFSLEPKEEDPCLLIMEVSGMRVELETDGEGGLKAVSVPSQKLKVLQSSS